LEENGKEIQKPDQIQRDGKKASVSGGRGGGMRAKEGEDKNKGGGQKN